MVATASRSGGPHKLDKSDLQQLNWELVSHWKDKLTEIGQLTSTTVSCQTICCWAHDLGYHSCVAAKKPFVNDQQKEKRLAFANDHLNWTVNDWRTVVWLDEPSFEIRKLSKQTHTSRKTKSTASS